MINFIKGFIIGIGKIIPGVSGAMLATIMGVYDKAIFYICNFKNNIKVAIKYLIDTMSLNKETTANLLFNQEDS